MGLGQIISVTVYCLYTTLSVYHVRIHDYLKHGPNINNTILLNEM